MSSSFWLSVITPIVSMFMVRGLFWIMRKHNANVLAKNANAEHIVIKTPRVCLLPAILAILFFVAVFILTVTSVRDGLVRLFAFVFFCLLTAIGVVMILAVCVWRIELNRGENFFVYRTMFFRTYKIYYSECISYTIERDNSITLWTRAEKEKIKIDGFANCHEVLLAELEKYHVKRQSGKAYK